MPVKRVSVIVPLHNKGAYVAETIDSVKNQSLGDWEMIIVENGSSDNGPEIAMAATASDMRIRFVEAPLDVRGPGAARNLGLAQAQGEWIQFLDADDLLLPGHFESQLRAVKDNPNADIITCDWLEGADLMTESCQRKQPSNSGTVTDWAASAIAFTPWVVHAAWVRMGALGEAPWWDEAMDKLVMEDHAFWFRLAVSSQAAYSSHCGVYYRLDTDLRRHNVSDLDRYLQGLEVAIKSNLGILAAAGKSLEYRHRRALMDLYLGLLRFDFPEEHCAWRSLVKRRIKEFRPAWTDALSQKDAVSMAAYVMQPELLHKLQVWRRTAKF